MTSFRPGHTKMCLMPYANNKGADQPAHPRSLISTFVVPCLDRHIFVLRGSFNVALLQLYGPRQANLVLIAYASSEGSGEPAHPRSLARTFAARSYKQWIKRNLQTENQIPGPSEWLGMRSWSLSWRNARRHKFAWRRSYDKEHGGTVQRYNSNIWVEILFFYTYG